MELKSFDEWSKAGFRIYKGEKARGRRREDNKPVFSSNQVYKPSYGDSYDEYEDAMMAGFFGFDGWGSNN